MKLTSVEPGPWRRVSGYFVGLIGAVLVSAVLFYFATHLTSLTDILAIILGAFTCLLGLMLLSLAIFLSAKSTTARRVGCVSAISFGVPFGLLFIFLVWSLFQPTRGIGGASAPPRPNSALERTSARRGDRVSSMSSERAGAAQL